MAFENINYFTKNNYISQESNYNFATICFGGLDNHQATKLRVCTLVVRVTSLEQLSVAEFSGE